MQVLVRLAERFGRKVAFVGRAMVQNTEIAMRLGFLSMPAGLQIHDSDVGSHPADVLCITTGSQGEPRSALSRIAIDDHRHVKIGPGDTVVLSARAIPGNEKAIGRVINHLTRRGADVVTTTDQARPRLRPRQRRGAEARVVAGASALLRAGARRVSAPGPAPARRANA